MCFLKELTISIILILLVVDVCPKQARRDIVEVSILPNDNLINGYMNLFLNKNYMSDNDRQIVEYLINSVYARERAVFVEKKKRKHGRMHWRQG
jgi:hypothetical protein